MTFSSVNGQNRSGRMAPTNVIPSAPATRIDHRGIFVLCGLVLSISVDSATSDCIRPSSPKPEAQMRRDDAVAGKRRSVIYRLDKRTRTRQCDETCEGY